MRKSLWVVLFLAVFMPLALASAQDDQTVVIRGFGNIANFSPLTSNDGASYQAYSLLYPAPFDVDSFTGEPVAGLTSWTVSDDGLTYTFTIRDGAQWSDGTPISADDMIFTINAIQDPDVATVLEPNVALISSVDKVDDQTYKVVLSEADCATLSQLGGIRFLPAHKFAADFSDVLDSAEFVNPTISGGPYILDSWAPDEGQRFHANPTYWAGEPKIPFLVNRVIGDQTVALQAIQAGEIDYTYFQGDLFEQIQNKDALQYQYFPQLSVNFLSMNWADPTTPEPAYVDGVATAQKPHPIFTDVAVRKAVAMGYNKADIIATLGGETGGTPLVGVVVPSISWAYDSTLQPYSYDPEAAKQLLEDDGWVDSDGDGVREKDGMKLSFKITYSDILTMFPTTALIIQDQLNQIGFDVQVELVEWQSYLDNVYLGQQYDATPMSNSGGTGGPPDPNDFTSLLLSTEDNPGAGNNLASYVNPKIDELIKEARVVPGCKTEDRAKIYYQIQELAHEDVAYDWTFTPNIYQIASKRIGGFNPGPSWVFYGYTSHVGEWTLDGAE